ncbi:MAG TPA: PfkB family carbohydrate kinase [Solirubrobacterales bacterium]
MTTFDLVHYVERFPRDDEKIQATDRWVGAGGPAANAAIAFASLGGNPTLLTAIGTGTLSVAARDDLSALGVRVVDLAEGGSLPTSSIIVDDSGRRTVVSLNARGFDESEMSNRTPDFEDPDVVVVDSHFPNVVKEVLSRIGASETPVVFDPGGYKDHVYDLMRECDHVIASCSLAPNLPSSQLLERLLSHGPRLAAVSVGSSPTVASIDGQAIELRVPQTDAIDTMGAGDVLHGAYAYGISNGAPLQRALEDATAIASQSCATHGPRPGGSLGMSTDIA